MSSLNRSKAILIRWDRSLSNSWPESITLFAYRAKLINNKLKRWAPPLSPIPEQWDIGKQKIYDFFPITEKEQERLIVELPEHLKAMVLFALNTGCRESEITGLKWSEEDKQQNIFILPGDRTKNGEHRIVPLNNLSSG